ncbi:MAG: hypothetical protein JWQ87_259 [Candidatus Sulfotelmatobacter sp.]|nr:hypothetical protein [Candidatus Sulfotelmatobacter sp.]
MNQNTCSTDSPRFHSHLFGVCRSRVHIGVLSIRLALQSFCRPRRPGKKHAVTVNTVRFFIPPTVHLHSTCIGLVGTGNAEDLDASHRGGIGGDVMKRMVRVARNPQPMENDSKFSGDRNDRSFLAVFAATLEHSRAPAFKITVRTKTPQQVLSALNQQRAASRIHAVALYGGTLQPSQSWELHGAQRAGRPPGAAFLISTHLLSPNTDLRFISGYFGYLYFPISILIGQLPSKRSPLNTERASFWFENKFLLSGADASFVILKSQPAMDRGGLRCAEVTEEYQGLQVIGGTI